MLSQKKYSEYLKEMIKLAIKYLLGIFLKDGPTLLATSITQICNLSIFLGTFPDACKIAIYCHFLKRVLKRIPRTMGHNFV